MKHLHIVNKILSPDDRKNIVISLSESHGYPSTPSFIKGGTGIFIGTNLITNDILSKNKYTNIYHTSFTPTCDKYFIDKCDAIRIKFNEQVYNDLLEQNYIDDDGRSMSKLFYPFYINPVVEIVSYIKNGKTYFSLSLSIKIVKREEFDRNIDYIFRLYKNNKPFTTPSSMYIGVNKYKNIHLFVTKLN